MWSIWAFFQVFLLVPLIEFLQIGIVLVTSLLFSQDYPNLANVFDGQTFDFIIVGAGTAGCVIANRLTEVENWSVLLIEAGDDPPYATEIPGLSVLMGATFPDWGYNTIDDKFASQALKSQKIRLIQGKMLGGSSNVNYMYHVRGNKEDFNNWKNRGNDGWDWNTVINYFKKSENFNNTYLMRKDTQSLHGTNGYLGITKPKMKEQTVNIFNALKENGHDILEDINGHQQLGYSVPSYNINNKRRQSGSFAFIKPIMNRRNLYVLKRTLATKIILKNNKAIGVTIESNNLIKNLYARKETIISAGSINSPQLLMLSGIGPGKHLEKTGIETKINIPNVGSNLQDHMLVPIMISGGNDTYFSDNLEPLTNLEDLPVTTIMGLVALDQTQRYPDYQVTSFPLPVGSLFPTLICSQIFGWKDEVCVAMANSTRQDTVFALISFLHPESRGTIKLRSNNSYDAPLIVPGYFSNQRDITKFAESVKDFTSLINTTYFRSVDAKIADFEVNQCRDKEFGTQKYWECYVLNMASSQFHFSGTCAMGPEGEGVVDERLRVRGVKNLRVADASVMPTVVSGNTNAAVVMIAEKASDMIKYDNKFYFTFSNSSSTTFTDHCEQNNYGYTSINVSL